MKTNKDFKKLSRKSKKNTKHISITGLQRLIKLMIILDQGTLNLDNAAQECGVSRRTIQRDIKLLQDAGISMYKPNEQNSNYRLSEGYSLSHFQVTKENALQFADTVLVLAKNMHKPFKLVSPIQKEVLKAGKKEQKKRNKDKYEIINTNATKDNVMSSFIDYEKNINILLLPVLFKMHQFFNETNLNNMAYQEWQMEEMSKIEARYMWIMGRYNTSLSSCKKMIEKNAKDAWAYKQAALVCYAKKDYANALLYSLDGWKQNSSDNILYNYCIYFAVLNKDYDLAVELFNNVIHIKQSQAEFAANIYANDGLFDKALEVIEKAKQEDKKSAKEYDKMKNEILKIKENRLTPYSLLEDSE